MAVNRRGPWTFGFPFKHRQPTLQPTKGSVWKRILVVYISSCLHRNLLKLLVRHMFEGPIWLICIFQDPSDEKYEWLMNIVKQQQEQIAELVRQRSNTAQPNPQELKPVFWLYIQYVQADPFSQTCNHPFQPRLLHHRSCLRSQLRGWMGMVTRRKSPAPGHKPPWKVNA